MIKPTSMAGWISSNPKMMNNVNRKVVDGNEVFLGLNLSVVSRKTARLDLVQNCDLPPPVKLFTGSDNKTVLSSMNQICTMNMFREDDDGTGREEFDMYGGRCDGDNEKLELLKALRLSQTRAREAENKAEKLAKEKDSVSNAFLAEARELFVYRQWVSSLELQVSKLRWQQVGQENPVCFDGARSKGMKQFVKEGDGGENGDGVAWILALAVCFGIAGVGFAFGCGYLC